MFLSPNSNLRASTLQKNEAFHALSVVVVHQPLVSDTIGQDVEDAEQPPHLSVL